VTKTKTAVWQDLGWAVVALVGIGFILSFTRAAMLPFVLALFFSVLLSPLMDVLCLRLKLPKAVSLGVLFGFVLCLMILLGLLLLSSIQDLLKDTQGYQEWVLSFIQTSLTQLEALGLRVDRTMVLNAIQDLPVFQMVGQTAGELVHFLGVGTLVVIFTFFLLAGREMGKSQSQIQKRMNHQIQTYVVTKLLTSLATGVLVGLILALLGVNYALMFGLVTFLLNFIPTLGSIVATLLPLPVVLMQTESVGVVIAAIGLPGLVQLAVGNVLEPKLMGNILDLHPLTLLLSLIFWGLLWGLAGMFLAVPMTAVVKLMCDQYESTAPLAKLLAGRFRFE
jgi:AI-2 transport protein TqsA